MVNYREILRLRSLGYSQRQITASVRSSRNTISDIFQIADENNLNWPLDPAMTDTALQELFCSDRISKSGRREPDYNHIHEELAKDGVTLNLLWSEYCESCYSEGTVPYMSTQFYDKYSKWARTTKATMRIKHKPGNVIMVDWAGKTLNIYDSVTGETVEAYLFVSVLPCSCYAYVEPCLDMKSGTWIACHVNMYNYFNGSSRIITPDYTAELIIPHIYRKTA